MRTERQWERERTRVRRPGERRRPGPWVALLLAWVAGGVDAIGYLTLGQLFTAHMSGNTAALGVHAGRADWSAALHRAAPLPAFLIGVVVGTVWIEVASRRGVRSPCAWAHLLELSFLAAFLAALHLRRGITGPARHFLGSSALLAALPSLAMGLQNATLRRVEGTEVRTTFVSGLLTDFAEQGAALVGGWTGGGAGRRRSVLRLKLYVGVWAVFLAGAVICAAAELLGAELALLMPLSGLAVLVAWDFRHPLRLRALQTHLPDDAGKTEAS